MENQILSFNWISKILSPQFCIIYSVCIISLCVGVVLFVSISNHIKAKKIMVANCEKFNKNFFDFCYTCFALHNDVEYPEYAGSLAESKCKRFIISTHTIDQSKVDFFSIDGNTYKFSIERIPFMIDDKYLKTGFEALLENHVGCPVTITKTNDITVDSNMYSINFILK